MALERSLPIVYSFRVVQIGLAPGSWQRDTQLPRVHERIYRLAGNDRRKQKRP